MIQFCAICYPHHARPKKTCPLANVTRIWLRTGDPEWQAAGRCKDHRNVPDADELSEYCFYPVRSS